MGAIVVSGWQRDKRQVWVWVLLWRGGSKSVKLREARGCCTLNVTSTRSDMDAKLQQPWEVSVACVGDRAEKPAE